jgi:chromosome segregation ATPase
MAYVRQRTTKAGAVSTALVEAYRDEKARPRQRLLANLYGEPDTLKALAKLAAQRETLRKEKEALAKDAAHANQVYETVTQSTLHGRQYTAAERKEIDQLMRQRDRLLKRLAKVEAGLAAIQKDGAIITKHCTATPDEIQAAIQVYKAELREAEALVWGLGLAEMMRGKEARAALRRLSPWAEKADVKKILSAAPGLRDEPPDLEA